MVHVSRLAEELVIWSSSEFNYVRLPEEWTSGSSIMPQKRNPDSAELLRGKSSRTIGNLTQILSLLKSQPLSYNRDLQEDKPPLFDSADTTLDALLVTGEIFKGLEVNRAEMAESCRRGFLLATELADYLARKGMPFREAHAVISKMVRWINADPKRGEDLERLSLRELQAFSPLFEKDIFQSLSLAHAAEKRNSYGGTGSKALSRQISKLKKLLREQKV